MDRIEKLMRFLEQRPDDVFVLHALALEYVKLGDEPSARAWFDRVLAVDPGHTGTYYHLAKLLERNGDREQALHVCEKGMEACRRAGDEHALRELRSVYEDLVY
jgi:tetratricopeptide (TPR) repeat protein